MKRNFYIFQNVEAQISSNWVAVLVNMYKILGNLVEKKRSKDNFVNFHKHVSKRRETRNVTRYENSTEFSANTRTKRLETRFPGGKYQCTKSYYILHSIEGRCIM